MMSPKVQEALNRQIHSEIRASYIYLAMSAWLEANHWVGSAKWMRLQSQEEYAHAMRLFDFVLARGGHVSLTELNAPRGQYGSLVDVFETAYKQEQTVTAQINNLYDVAFQAKSFDAVVQAEWFVNEQVEEEKTMREIVAKLQMVKDDPPSLLDFDRDLGARQPEAEAEGEAE
jgi:ferritin